MVTVTAPRAKLSTGAEVGFGTQLPVVGPQRSSLVVLTPAGTKAKLPAAAAKPLPRTRADLVRSAKQFLGLKYLWGGLSAWGYDCSGLTWAVYRAHGITIPRDADAQATAGRPMSLEDAQPGDLIFYGTSFVHHVTMYLGKGMMIEAPNSASEVRIARSAPTTSPACARTCRRCVGPRSRSFPSRHIARVARKHQSVSQLVSTSGAGGSRRTRRRTRPPSSSSSRNRPRSSVSPVAAIVPSSRCNLDRRARRRSELAEHHEPARPVGRRRRSRGRSRRR